MKKPSILFVCASMKVGGAEKSLINLLNLIDYSAYNIDLLLFQKQGGFLNQIPSDVNLVARKMGLKALYDNVSLSPKTVLIKIIKYVSTLYETLRWKHYDVAHAHRWVDVYSKICEPIEKEYDVVIAFQSGEPTYFAFEKVKAKRKVTFFHTDIKNIFLDKTIEQQYLKIADLIVAVSEKCLESITQSFNDCIDKTVCLENLSSEKMIKELAGNNPPKELNLGVDTVKIISVGRLVYLKGYDIAIDAAKILVDKGHKIQWLVIGEGNERSKLETQIKKNGLEKDFQMIGLRLNPYPYIKYADILVQSSRYEGKSVVLDEAKILEKQIVVTNYNSVEDQIKNGVDGLIAEMSAEGLANQIINILEHPLEKHNVVKNNKNEVNKYMNMLVYGQH